MVSDWRINFFDLGLFTGDETAEFLRIVDSMAEGRERPIACVYGVDAHSAYARYCTQRFADNPRVFIHNLAIGSEERMTQLYLGAKLEASSLYRRKHDVPGGVSFPVSETRFSEFIRGLGLDRKDPQTVNILKANIEGAEWDLICDLEASGMWGLFDIFLGSNQWTADMAKCTDLLPFIAKARRILDGHGVVVKPFCMGTANYPDQPPNCDLRAEILSVMERANAACTG